MRKAKAHLSLPAFQLWGDVAVCEQPACREWGLCSLGRALCHILCGIERFRQGTESKSSGTCQQG